METSYYFNPVNSQPYAFSTCSPDPYYAGEALVDNYLTVQPARKHKQRSRKEAVSVVLPKVEYLADSQNPEVFKRLSDQRSSTSKYLQAKSPPKELKNNISIKRININSTRFSKSVSFRSLSSFKETPCSRQSIRINGDKPKSTQLQDKQEQARKRNIQRSSSCSKISYYTYLNRHFSENGSKSNLLNTRFSIISALDAGNRLIYTKPDNNLHTSIRIPVQNMHVGKLNISKLQNLIKVVPIEGEGLIRKVSSTEFVPMVLANSQSSCHSMLKRYRNSKHNNL